jgi:GH35 family endo-1,4-beta-xylanase
MDTMDKFPNIEAVNLVNESRVPVRDDDKLMKLLGENYILDAYRVARQHAKETGRDIKLLFSETANHYPSEYTNSTLYFSEKLAAAGLIDGVAVQGHLLLNQWVPDIDKEGMKRIFAGYPVPVWITEADVNLTLIGGSDGQRSRKLAEEYINLVGACVESGNCKVISFFNGWDSRSWLENGSIDSGSKNADGTLYSGTDTNHTKRLAFYAIMKSLYGYVQNIER